MVEHDGEREHAVTTVLLWLSKEPPILTWVLERLVPASALAAAIRGTGQAVAPGGAARTAARKLPRSPRLASAVVRVLLENLPGPSSADAAEPDGLAEEARRQLSAALLTGEEAGAQAAMELARRCGDNLAPVADVTEPVPVRASRPASAQRKTRVPKPAPDPAFELSRMREEATANQEERNRQIAQNRQLTEDLEQARAEARNEKRRAADLKKRLAEAAAPSSREQTLEEDAAQARRELSVITQKFKLVEEERDDLRACLEDYDRFQALVAEEIPSFRKRPLLAEEVDLAHRVAADGRRFRILVVGGGEPQFRHRDKLAEYADLLGFSSEWRMAEYVSWHRELDKLGADMKTRFDALVILHYNRTTFTRHARSICDEAGHKPCITCHYEGFTSLRAVLREALRQLLDRKRED